MTSARIVFRALCGLCGGLVFLLVCLCLSEIPEVLRGPIGFKPEPPAVLAVIKEILPTVWSALIGGTLFGVIVFRHGTGGRIAPLQVALTLLSLMTCMGLTCALLIIHDHAVYAVDPEHPSNFRVGANVILVGLLGLMAMLSPSGHGAPPAASPSHEAALK